MKAIAWSSDSECLGCGSGRELLEWTNAGEATLRLECDGCGWQWSIPEGQR